MADEQTPLRKGIRRVGAVEEMRSPDVFLLSLLYVLFFPSLICMVYLLIHSRFSVLLVIDLARVSRTLGIQSLVITS